MRISLTKNISKKIFSLAGIILVLFSSFISVPPKPTYAIVGDAVTIVGDVSPTEIADTAANISSEIHAWALEIKEYILDGLVWTIVNQLIERMAAAVVDWINSGFEGKPAFVQNFKKFYQDLDNAVFADFINEFDHGNICQPFANKIRRSFEIQYALYQGGRENAWRRASQCTLDRFLAIQQTSIEEFSNDFSKGGWGAWLHLVQPQNNQYGAYLIYRDELNLRQAEKRGEKKEELTFGRGFLSFRRQGECLEFNTESGSSEGEADDTRYEYDPTIGDVEVSLGGGACLERAPDRIMTPGSLIQEKLDHALGSGERRIEAGDEIDEIISALLNQLMTQVLGPNGLFGASQSGAGSSSYTDRLRTNQEDLATQKTRLRIVLSDAISRLEDYISVKREIRSVVAETLVFLNEVKSCLEPKASSGFQDELDITNRYISQLEIELTQIDDNIETAENQQTEYGALLVELDGADTTGEISAIADEYNRISGLGVSQTLLSNSVVNEPSATEDRMADIQSETRRYLIACQGFGF